MAYTRHSPLFIFVSHLLFSTSKAQEEISTDPSYYYNLCEPSTCGTLPLSYPFALSPFCRTPTIVISCTSDGTLTLWSDIQRELYRVVRNFTSGATGGTVFVASDALFTCAPLSRPSYRRDATIFSLGNDYTWGTHLNCTKRPSAGQRLEPASCLGCKGVADDNVCFYSPGFVTFPECEVYYIFTEMRFNVSAEKDLKAYLRRGYELRYTKNETCRSCEISGGRCGTSPAGSLVCFCPSSVHTMNCSDGMIEDLKTWVPSNGGSRVSKKLVAALSASLSAATLLILVILVGTFAIRRNPKIEEDGEDEKTQNGGTQTDIKDLVSGISPSRYSYSQIKKFTTNFSIKLGQGGFGSVYKGIIRDTGKEIPVAIKLLKNSKQSEKQFMNEVATVGRIHHNNLVRLIGYCAQGTNRSLVYEFMEKGSLDKYIYSTNRGEECKLQKLTPQQKYNIALEVARGILYLHQGCRSRILHCDIKPHNVLLDYNFSAKVADFGLARMIDKDRSHDSLTNPGGTPGYAAPEMWLKSYGSVTEKTDVYGYGMLLLEMTGGRKNYDSGSEIATSQVYFPEWVFQQTKKIEFVTEGRMDNSIEITGDDRKQEDEDIVKKMYLVSLWCIQHNPSCRPTMSNVIQMLEGNVQIETPPQPFPQDSGDNDARRSSIAGSTIYITASDHPIDEPSISVVS